MNLPKSRHLPLQRLHFALRTEVLFGPGTLGQLGEIAVAQGGRRILLVTDPGIVAAGHADRAASILRSAGLEVAVFDRVVENPTTAVVEACTAAARDAGVDLLVGLGGGSSMDTAKGCNFLLTNGGRMEDYWGVGKAQLPMLPTIAVPTTAGTGSECQSFAIISQDRTHAKMACGDPKAAARVAILDPELTVTQPAGVALACGIDALAHAIESAVSRRRNPLSQVFSREAFRLVARGLPRVLQAGDDLEARGDVLLGASLAGMAIENSMLGAAHAAANPLTARFDWVHGLAVGMMIPSVIRFNSEEPEAARIYEELAVVAGLAGDRHGPRRAGPLLAEFLEALLAQSPARRLIEAAAIGPDLRRSLAEEASRQWTARFNPRPVGAEEFERLYEAALTPHAWY
jgi:alcohol dehydrogenase